MRLVCVPISLLMVCLGACAHGGHGTATLSNEARLDAATESSGEGVDVNTLICRYTSPEVQIARDGSQARQERIDRYTNTIKHAQATEAQFDEEFRRDPDLIYGPKASEYQKRRQACVDLVVTLERERAALEEEGPQKTAPAAQAAVSSAHADMAFVDDGAAKPSKTTKAKKAKVAKAGKHRKGGARIARAD